MPTSLLLLVAVHRTLCGYTPGRSPPATPGASSAAAARAGSAGSKYPFLAKQSLGQNFLVDDSLARRIVNSVVAERVGVDGSALVELGPGQGALTKHALPLWPRMTALELDKRAIASLAVSLPTLKIMQGDMLRTDWAALAASAEGAPRVSVLSNPPYHLTAELLLLLVLNAASVSSCVLTLQREAVERLLSPPGCKSYTALGVVFALYARVEVLFELPPEAFSPAPKVTSTCMRIAFAPPAVCAEPAPGEGGGDGVQASARRPINLHSDVRAIHGLARAAFMERRKMLRQALKPFLAGLAQPAPDADGAAPAPRELPERFATLRAEQLAPADFVELADALGLLSSTTAPAAT